MQIPRLSILTLILAGVAAADVPRKAPLRNYSVLWTKSPFTTPPLQVGPEPLKDPFEDYALVGVSPVGPGQYRVTLINKKRPDDRIMVFTDSEPSEFQIVGITRKAGDVLGTVVTMKSGNQTGTVSYDEKLLTLTAPPSPKPPIQLPGTKVPVHGQGDPNQVRTPRSRGAAPPAGPAPRSIY